MQAPPRPMAVRRLLATATLTALVTGAVGSAAPVSAAVEGDTCSVKNLRVNVPRPTFEAALGESQAGDTLVVRGQCFPGQESVIQVPLTILGKRTPLAGIPAIDGGEEGRLFTISSTVTVVGLTIRNGNATVETSTEGGAFRVTSTGRLTLRDVRLVRNQAEAGGAIHSSGRVILEGTTEVARNAATESGAAIRSTQEDPKVTPVVIIRGSAVLHHNQSPSAMAIAATLSRVTIGGDAVIRDHEADVDRSGAIDLGGSSLTVGGKALITRNSGSFGGAIQGINATGDGPRSRIVIKGSARLIENTTDQYGAAISAEGDVLILESAVIRDNTNTSENGGAVEIWGYNSVPVSLTMKGDSRIRNNTSAAGGGGVVRWTGCGSVPVLSGLKGRVVNNTPKNIVTYADPSEC